MFLYYKKIYNIYSILIQTSSIIQDYESLSDNIKAGLIDSVLVGDETEFNSYIEDLGLNLSKSDLLFEFIERTSTLQTGIYNLSIISI